MLTLLLWLLLLVVCWPLALIALILWPLVWLISIPFRLLGIAFEGVFALMRAAILLPALIGFRPARPQDRHFLKTVHAIHPPENRGIGINKRQRLRCQMVHHSGRISKLLAMRS